MSYSEQSAAHDTALYDSSIHDNQIVAMYDTDEQARAAQGALVSSGVPETAVKLVTQADSKGDGDAGQAEDRPSPFWNAVKSLFMASDDTTDYSQAAGHGHALLILTPTADMDRMKAIQTLEQTGPVDFDARLEEWRQAGYDMGSTRPNEGGERKEGVEAGEANVQAPRWRREKTRGSRVRSYIAER